MITFHPAARKVAAGYLPSVMLRNSLGQCVGSKVTQNGNTFETAELARSHAIIAALRVAARFPTLMAVKA